MPCTLYLDTSILCALADPPARSAYARTCQSLTRRWLRSLPHTAHLCTSELALQRLGSGPPQLTSARLTVADSLSVLPFKKNFRRKSKLFIAGGGLTGNFDDILPRVDFITPLQLLETDYETLLPSTGHRLP